MLLQTLTPVWVSYAQEMNKETVTSQSRFLLSNAPNYPVLLYGHMHNLEGRTSAKLNTHNFWTLTPMATYNNYTEILHSAKQPVLEDDGGPLGIDWPKTPLY